MTNKKTNTKATKPAKKSALPKDDPCQCCHIRQSTAGDSLCDVCRHADEDFDCDSDGENIYPTHSCEECDCDLFEDEGPICDQCDWYRSH